MADLSIVIVNWNTRELLRECLQSIYGGHAPLDLQVLVVDNASGDGSAEMVSAEFPQVHLIRNAENVGFAAANNQVLAACSSELVLLLNPDTRVRGDALAVLVEFMREHPQAGAAGPKVVHPAMRLRVLSCGYQPTLRTLFNQYSGLSSLFPRSERFRGINLLINVHDDRPRAVEWLSGACLLVRKRVIDEVGPLNEKWFMYSEDMEWCHRIAAAGWKLYHVPTAVIEHHLGAGSSQNARVSTMWVQSLRSYYVLKDHPSGFKRRLFDAVLFCGLAFRAACYALRALLGRGGRRMWWAEALKFGAYARAALTPVNRV